jgi:hypothetical protein
MTIQTLAEFQTSFGSKPIEVNLSEKFGKDAVFYLKPLVSMERDAFEASVVGNEKSGRNLNNLRAKLVALCWCDKAGKPVGTAKEIGTLRADLVGGLFDEIRSINGMDSDEAVEDAAKS